MASEFDILGLFVPNAILSEVFSQLLLLQDICQFDSAICSKNRRNVFLEFIRSECCIFLGDKDRTFNSNAISWLHIRSLKIRHLKCDLITDDISSKIGDMGCCLHWLSLKDGDLKEENVITIIDSCPNLQSVELSRSLGSSSSNVNITDSSIIRIVERCPHLHSLNLAGISHITDTSIIRVAERYPNLVSLSLIGSFLITDKSVIKIAEICANLYSLKLKGCTLITDRSIVRIAEKCPNLHYLNLRGCHHITDTSIVGIAEGCPNLHRLDLLHCARITTASVVRLLFFVEYLTYP
jgi:hypothetical protein